MAQAKTKIHCRYDELVNPANLRPHPANPAIHPESQIKLLAKIINEHGIRWPITVSNQSGFIVSGHCRRLAAIELCLKKYPVAYQDFASKSEELAVLVADNAIQELAEVDDGKMGDIVRELTASSYDLELACVDAEDLIPADDKDMIYTEEEIRPYQQTHVLLSFPPEKLMDIQPLLDEIIKTPSVEYEQSSN